MEFVIGGVSALMDARFAAAAGTERVVLHPWISRPQSNRGIGFLPEAIGELEGTPEEILKQALAVWNEIKGWVSGPEIWLAAPWPYLPMALEAFETFDGCCGVMVTDAQSAAPTVLQHPPFEIPPRVPYAVNYAPWTPGIPKALGIPGPPGITNAWTAQNPPDWVVIAPDSIMTLPLNVDTLRYLRVETLDEVMALQTRQGLPRFAGIYLQANAPEEGTDYEVWQEIIDRICL
ncbi:MAG: hypothetical protein FJ350_03105 [Sphingomonadales bacterium]|nr:hypothetical protein [Sphingomonadales bacterium]MBM3923746.1 hypothetical protein [Sphingomonadales bacterium]MBM3932108.1 hypothetical protein [Sphingomonadales bacterium]